MFIQMFIQKFILVALFVYIFIYMQLNRTVSEPRTGFIGDRGSRESEYKHISYVFVTLNVTSGLFLCFSSCDSVGFWTLMVFLFLLLCKLTF